MKKEIIMCDLCQEEFTRENPYTSILHFDFHKDCFRKLGDLIVQSRKYKDDVYETYFNAQIAGDIKEMIEYWWEHEIKHMDMSFQESKPEPEPELKPEPFEAVEQPWEPVFKAPESSTFEIKNGSYEVMK